MNRFALLLAEAQEIYEDLEVPILATHEVADIVEAVQKMQVQVCWFLRSPLSMPLCSFEGLAL